MSKEVKPTKELKKNLVRQYIENGYNYRHIAEKMGFKSINTVAYYAKGVHQHRLVQVINSEEWKCTKCSAYFVQLKAEL